MSNVRIPDQVEEVNANWVSKIIGKNVSESTFKLTLGANDGNGFLSTLVRAEFKTENEPNKLQSVIVKLLPSETDMGGLCRSTVLNDNNDIAEINSYQILIPELVREVPDLQKYICDVIYGKVQNANFAEGIPYNSVLVLKDLKPEGYKIVTIAHDWQQGHFTQGLDFIIKFHAAAASFEKRLKSSIISTYESWFPKCYNFIPTLDDLPAVYEYFPAGFPGIYKLLPRYPDVTLEITECMENIEKNSKVIFRAIINAGLEFACLVHGDLWTHNILVKDDPTSPIKVIDWQMIGYTDPAFDLGIYLMWCLPKTSLTSDGVNNAVKEYYTKYSELLENIGADLQRTREQFETFFQSFGLAFCLMIMLGCPPFVCDPDNPEAEPRFHKMFKILIENKVLDFMLSLI